MAKGMLLLLVSLFATPALADEASDAARALDEAFLKHAEAGDVDGALALYADDATIIWPGLGEEAKGKKAIEPFLRDFVASLKHAKLTLKAVDARPLGAGYIVNNGHWEETSAGPDGKSRTSTLRTTEVSIKQGDKWLFVVDHASIGMPPPKAARTKTSPPSHGH